MTNRCLTKFLSHDRKYMLQGHDFSNLATFSIESIEKKKVIFQKVFHGSV